MKGLTPEQIIDRMLIQNTQHSIRSELQRQSIFTYVDGMTKSLQQGVFRINCIDCLDRTNNVQLTLGMIICTMQIESLQKKVDANSLVNHLKEMWINNGDHISRIYTGTGAIGQRSKVSRQSLPVGISLSSFICFSFFLVLKRPKIFNVVSVELYKTVYAMMRNNSQFKR